LQQQQNNRQARAQRFLQSQMQQWQGQHQPTGISLQQRALGCLPLG
jgi:hypothetical protein